MSDDKPSQRLRPIKKGNREYPIPIAMNRNRLLEAICTYSGDV
ncbi:hypothetical protein [Nostoc sp.]